MRRCGRWCVAFGATFKILLCQCNTHTCDLENSVRIYDNGLCGLGDLARGGGCGGHVVRRVYNVGKGESLRVTS